MEIPLDHFEHLPRQLGCSLMRTAGHLTLASDQPGCAMHFRLDGGQARLERVEVTDDPQGHFLRDVVGLALQLYSGDLEAELTWSPCGSMETQVEVHAGETVHPLLFQPMPVLDLTVSLVEQWLADARRAWGEYQRLKDAGKSRPEA